MISKTLLSVIVAIGVLFNPKMALAQSLPPSVRTPEADNTLGTQVAGDGNNFNISGGLSRGQTLFHSFKDFSIPTGGSANFNNPAGTRDIISRVTGNLFSDINGTLNSSGANFLLINPNGVVFGPNAKLNVGKAFAASTASGVDLVDGQGRQVTFGTSRNGDAPLLTIDPNVFFNVSRLHMGTNVPNHPGIVNYGTLQTNNDSQYLGLIGGNVTLDGKYGGGKIFAPGGRVDLGGLNSVGTITTDAQGLVFGGNGLIRGDVLLTNDASVIARADRALNTVSPFFSNVPVAGSSININANNLNLLNSGAKSDTGSAAIDNGLETNSGVKTNPAGDINIDATGQVNLDNANIKNTIRSGAEGKIGDIKINANSLDIRNRSVISSATAGKGNAGNVDIKTTGDISIFATTSSLTNPNSQTFISTTTNGQAGNAGKITINTQNRGKLLLDGSAIFSAIGRNTVGNGNDIDISAQSVDLRYGFIFSSSLGGIGDVGNIKIDTTDALKLNENSVISTASKGRGKTGDIFLNSDRITLNRGNISAESLSETGGNIQITTQALLLLRNLSNIATNSDSINKNSNGGNITLNSPIIIALPGDNNIAANAVGGNGGRLDIASQGLFGIKYRPKGQDSIFTNDITSSSEFGQSGTVNISTPGTDPGRDSTVLPTVPTDASNQIAQTCNASRENKFIIAGRGGLPPNADDPLTSDVVWQDSRANNSQPTASAKTTDLNKLPPPAVGLTFDGKGKAFLIAAGSEGQPTKTKITCPQTR